MSRHMCRCAHRAEPAAHAYVRKWQGGRRGKERPSTHLLARRRDNDALPFVEALDSCLVISKVKKNGARAVVTGEALSHREVGVAAEVEQGPRAVHARWEPAARTCSL